MKLTDDQIRSIMEKKVVCKTILVENDKIEQIISDHTKDNWKLVKQTELNGKTKLTFKK